MLNGTKDKWPIIEYNVIGNSQVENLIRKVNAAIGKGWQPFGPIVVATAQHGDYGRTDNYFQTMVRYSESYETK